MSSTALVIPFPDLEPAVSRFRAAHDPFAALGVPAHITIHFPWRPLADVGEDDLAQLRELVRSVPPIPVTFERPRWFGSSVLWLEPSPDEPFRAMAARSQALWPDFPLYEGEFDEVVPHLTVGVVPEGGDDRELRAVERELASLLPVHTQATELLWLTPRADGHWQRRQAFSLAKRPSASGRN